MGADAPAELHILFAKHYNAGDLDGLMSLYEENASLVAAPGIAVSGTDAIREALASMVALKGTIEFVGEGTSYESGDLVLTHGTWVMTAEGMDEIRATTAEVARRQADGTWQYVIDNPFGTQPAGA